MFFTKRKSSGDLVVCQTPKSGPGAKSSDISISADDRFLHTLILGPTGCGKTYKSMLPMIYQDIKNPDWGITIMDAKGDLALATYLLAKDAGREAVLFDPTYKNCAKFNPLAGPEIDVVENMVSVFNAINSESPQFFRDQNERLLRSAVKVLKRLDADEGVKGSMPRSFALTDCYKMQKVGREWVNKLVTISTKSDTEAAENRDIASWFLNEYFPEHSKAYENTSGIRSQIAKLVSNEYLREVLNPDFDMGETNEIDFAAHLANNSILCISTAPDILRNLSRYLSLFIIHSFQSAAFRQKQKDQNPHSHALYIEDLYNFSNHNLSNLLIAGHQLHVSVNMTAQSRSLVTPGRSIDDRNFIEVVSANTRNVILYEGLNKDDLRYYISQDESIANIDGWGADDAGISPIASAVRMRPPRLSVLLLRAEQFAPSSWLCQLSRRAFGRFAGKGRGLQEAIRALLRVS